MTVERSKRRFLIPIVFTTKCFKKTSNDYSILFILYSMGEVSYNWIGKDGFEVKSETERFIVVCPRCRQNLKIGHFKLWF